MNVRLYDGTVRCTEHFDASSYQSETSDPCLYCTGGDLSADDQEWLNALSTLVIDQPRRTLRLGKTRPCDRCDQVATWKIVDGTSVDDFLCTDHGQEWYPDLFPDTWTRINRSTGQPELVTEGEIVAHAPIWR